MGKVVYNACFGGFGLSDAAINLYAKLQGLTLYPEKDGFGSTTWWTKPQSERTAILEGDEWYSASQEQRAASNEAHSAATLYGTRHIPNRPDPSTGGRDIGRGGQWTIRKIVRCRDSIRSALSHR